MALLTDGRFSGATHGLMAGHVAPEAAAGGPIAAVRDGDEIVFDLATRRLDLAVDEPEIAARLDRLDTAAAPLRPRRLRQVRRDRHVRREGGCDELTHGMSRRREVPVTSVAAGPGRW